mgnify:CR=1 FL=1
MVCSVFPFAKSSASRAAASPSGYGVYTPNRLYVGGEAIFDNEHIQEVIHSRTIVRPQADPDLCTACGTCVDHCTVSALSMVDNLPRVDADTCITCFCCQELCPEKAITLR